MISDIHLQQFRSYLDVSFEFGEGVNIIVGPNASGKTNLIEALLYVARGKSYRVSDAELVAFGHEWARLDVHTRGGGERTIKLRLMPQPQKSYHIDGKDYVRLPQAQHLPVVIFEPNHLTILQGPPEGRRAYLDDLLEEVEPGYAALRKNYRRVVAQRNALLKRPGAARQDFFPWNLRLSELGAVVHRTRAALVDRLNDQINGLYKKLSSTEVDVRLKYTSRLPTNNYESHLLRALEDQLQDDLARGFTSHGPHREDMAVLFDGKPAPLIASRGETRTAVLALKILELQTIQKATGDEPILLLDDVFSELDGARRRALTAHLQRYQTFLTTTDADIAVKHFTDSVIIPVTRG